MNKKHTPSRKLYSIYNIYKQLEKDSDQCISLIRNSALPILFLSQKGIITYVNQSFSQMVGYSNSEIINESILLFIKTQHDNASENNLFVDIIKKKRNGDKTFEIQFCKKTDELGWATIETLTHKRESVNHERFIQCVLRDITREKELQSEIDRLHKANQEQATMFQNLIENTENHILVRKLDSTIVWANRLFLELYGSSLDEIVGKTELNLWPIEDVKKIDTARSLAIQDRERKNIELVIEHEGAKYTILMTIFPMFNEYGEVEYIGEIKYHNQSRPLNNEQKWVCAGPLCTRRMLPLFIDNSISPICAVDIAGKLIEINQAFADIYGIPRKDLINKLKKEVDVLSGLEGNNDTEEIDRQVLKSKQNIVFESNIIHPISKKMLHFNCTKFPLFSDDGEIYGLGTIMTDRTQITEHTMELEKTRRDAYLYKLKAEYNEYLLQSYIDSIPHYVVVIDLEGKAEFINQYALNLWGDTKENVINKHYTEYIKDSHFSEYVAKDLDFVISNEKYIETEEVFSRSDKDDIVLLSTVFPLFNKAGVLFAIGIFRKDVTESKRAQQETERLQQDIKEQHSLLSTIIDSAPDYIFVKNKEYRYVMVNQAFARSMDLTKSDFVGKNDLELGFSEELVKGNQKKGIIGLWADNQNVMDGGQVQTSLNDQVIFDGVVYTYRTTKTPLKNADGEVWGVLTFAHDITHELKQQDVIRQAKERFKNLYNSTPAMLYSINAEAEIITVSDYWLKVMGYDREEVIGHKLSRFVTDESLQYSREVVWPLFLKQGSCSNEKFQFIKRNGEIITCLFSAVAEKDKDGQFLGSLEVLVDVTKLIEKDVEIATTKRLLQDFLDNIPYPVMILDLQERIMLTNNEHCRKLHNKSKQDIIGLHHKEYVTNPELLEYINNGNAYVLKNQQSIRIQKNVVLPTGENRILSTYKFPLYSSTDEFSYIGVIIDDITDQISREKELIEAHRKTEKSKRLLQGFLDNAASAMFAKDENGFYIFTNKKKDEFELLRQKQANSNPELSSLCIENKSLSRMEDARVVRQNVPITFYDRLLANDSVLYTETVKFPIYDIDNKLIGVGGITKDITDTVIHEKELEDARQKAEDAASSQELFLASMSHDMRTPLNGVVGMINLMEQTDLSSEQKEYIEAMKVSSYNLRVLINDILDISKIQAGKLNIECVLFDLNEILISVKHIFMHEACKKGVLFSMEIQPDIPVILEGDPLRLSQILNNLIGNALKFTNVGYVSLKLEHENLPGDKVNVKFVVEDSGIGISEDGLGKLFQPFVQANSNTTRKFGGSGLGLSICKSLVELQQGEIGVNSTIGKGSVFYFRITYIKAKQEKVKLLKKSNEDEPISVEQLPPMRCLVFEDNLINQKVAFHTLKKLGIQADMADNGKIGLDVLRKGSVLYDFVLMDIQMPEMGGYEATSLIRNELGLKIPIIAMTASALKGEKERCMELGMNDFVPKPFVIDELLYVVKKLIKKGQKKEQCTPQTANEVVGDATKAEILKRQIGFGNVPLYDMTNVLEINDDDFTLEILNTFLDTVPKALEELKTSISEAIDWDAVTKVAHKLKGGVGVLQMTEMIKYLSAIEISARNREILDQLPDALDICCRIYDAVKDEITQMRDETKTKMREG